MTLISRRDAGKILLAGSTGLVLGVQNALASAPAIPASPQAEGQAAQELRPGTDDDVPHESCHGRDL